MQGQPFNCAALTGRGRCGKTGRHDPENPSRAPSTRAQTAISASGRADLTYGLFASLCEETAAALRARGLARNDKLAIVLPNGPDMAASFVAAATAVTAAPLNPAYREDEFHFYMDDLKARALLVEEGEHLSRHRRRAPAGHSGADAASRARGRRLHDLGRRRRAAR